MEKVTQVIEQTLTQSSRDSKQICATPSTTSESRFTEDEMAKATMFFARIQTIYGKGRCKTLFSNAEELRMMRREWAKTLGEFSMEQLEKIMARLKQMLADGDERFRFPDVAQILALANDKKRDPAHKPFPKGLPEPEWRTKQKREFGRKAIKGCLAELNGRGGAA